MMDVSRWSLVNTPAALKASIDPFLKGTGKVEPRDCRIKQPQATHDLGGVGANNHDSNATSESRKQPIEGNSVGIGEVVTYGN
jgi:hypothetical protein